MKIFYTRNEERRLQTRTENKKFYLIGTYLDTDIQGDDKSCQEIIMYLEEVLSGKREEFDTDGNA
ncbi:MAG: hypothetical protein P1V18_00015, partial [Candidatus Gracilibacteria bacterium]|nr:hypothetical protein [Candidatus Gracilibacteria bacterium]